MGSTLATVFIVGGSWFSAWTVITFLVSWFRWRRQGENPGHLVVWAHAALAILYWFLFVDFGFYLRSDGVELPWLRMAAEIAIYLSYSWMVSISLWLDWDDAWIAVGATGLGGTLVTLSHLAKGSLYWWGWGIGVGMLALTQLWELRRSRRPDLLAWLFFVGWLVWIIGVPLVQLLGWTMTQVLDESHHRSTTEILYLIVYGVVVTFYGCAQIGLFSSRPLDKPLEKLEPASVPGQREFGYLTSPNDLVSSNIASHRHTTWMQEE